MSKAVFKEHFEQIWNKKEMSGIPRFIAPNYRGHEAGNPEIIFGVEGYKQHFVTITTGFPDMRITIEDILPLAEEDRVAARWLVEATHKGNFAGIPPTGKRVHFTGISIARITNRRLVEEHTNADTLSVLKQIGVIDESLKAVPLLF